MPTYRLYRLDGAGKIASAEWVDAADDDDAMSQAGTMASGQAETYELWDRNRLVARNGRPPDDPA